MALTEQTLKMARISGLDYATATDYMTNAVRSFKMEMTEAQTVVDVYSAIAASSATSTTELASAMSKTASSAQAVGSSFENTTAMMAVMIEATRESAENIGSAMKSIISRYGEMTSDPSKLTDSEGEEMSLNRVDKALQTVGISIHDAAGQFRDFDEVIMELAEHWNTIDTNTQRYIATIMAGNRQQSRFLALVSSYDRLKELSAVAADSEDAAQLQFLKTLDSVEAKLQQFQTSMQSLYVGSGLENFYKWLLDMGNNIVKTFTAMPKLFKLPIPAITKFGAQFLNLSLIVVNAFKMIKARIMQSNKELAIINKVANQERLSEAESTELQRLIIEENKYTELKEIIRENESELTNIQNQEEQKRLQLSQQYAKQQLSTQTRNQRGGMALSAGGLALSTIGSMLPTEQAELKGGLSMGGGILQGLGTAAFMGFTTTGKILGVLTALPSIIEGIATWMGAAEAKLNRLKEDAANKTNEAIKAKDETKSLSAQIIELKKLEAARYDSVEAEEAYYEAVDQLLDLYPDLIKSMDGTGNATADLTAAELELAKLRKKSVSAAQEAAIAEYKLRVVENQQENNKISEDLDLRDELFKLAFGQIQIDGKTLDDYLASINMSESDKKSNKDLMLQTLNRGYANFIAADSSQIDLFYDYHDAINNWVNSMMNEFIGWSTQQTELQTNGIQDYINQEYSEISFKNSSDLVTLLEQTLNTNSNIKDIRTSNALTATAMRSGIARVVGAALSDYENEYVNQVASFSSFITTAAIELLNDTYGDGAVSEKDYDNFISTQLLSFITTYTDSWETFLFNINSNFNGLDDLINLLKNSKNLSPDQFRSQFEKFAQFYDQEQEIDFNTFATSIIKDLYNNVYTVDQFINRYISKIDPEQTTLTEAQRDLAQHMQQYENEIFESLGANELIQVNKYYDQLEKQINADNKKDLKGQLDAYIAIIQQISQFDETAQAIFYSWDGTLSGLYTIQQQLQDYFNNTEINENTTELDTKLGEFIASIPINLNTEFESLLQNLLNQTEDFEKALSNAFKGMSFKDALDMSERLQISITDFRVEDGKYFYNNAEKIKEVYYKYNEELLENLNQRFNQITPDDSAEYANLKASHEAVVAATEEYGQYQINAALIQNGFIEAFIESLMGEGTDINAVRSHIFAGDYSDFTGENEQYISLLMDYVNNLGKNVLDKAMSSIKGEGAQHISVNESNRALLELLNATFIGDNEAILDLTKQNFETMHNAIVSAAADGLITEQQMQSYLTDLHNNQYKDNAVDSLNSVIGNYQSFSYDVAQSLVNAFDQYSSVEQMKEQGLISLDETTGKYSIALTELRTLLAGIKNNTSSENYAQLLSKIEKAERETNINYVIQDIIKNRNKLNEDNITTLATALNKDYETVKSWLKQNDDGSYTLELSQLRALINDKTIQVSQDFTELISGEIDSIVENATNLLSNQSKGYTNIAEMQQMVEAINEVKIEGNKVDFQDIFIWDDTLKSYVLTTQGIIEQFKLKQQELQNYEKDSVEYLAALKLLQGSKDQILSNLNFMDLISGNKAERTLAVQKYTEIIEAYNDAARALAYLEGATTVGIIDAAETVKQLQAGGATAVAVAQSIAEQRGEVLTDSDINAIYFSQVNDILAAVEELDNLSLNSIISSTTVEALIKSKNSLSSTVLSEGKLVIKSMTDVIAAYNELYRQLAETGEATLEQLNDLEAKILVKSGDSVLVNALKQAGSMGYEELGKLFTTAGYNLHDSLESIQPLLTDLGGGQVLINDFSTLAKMLQLGESSSEAYIDALKTYNDARINANNKAQKDIAEEVKNLKDVKPGNQINVTRLYSELLGSEALEVLQLVLAKYGAELNEGILTFSDKANIPAIQQAIYDSARENELMLTEDLEELAEVIDNTLKSFADLIAGSITGNLTNKQTTQLQNSVNNILPDFTEKYGQLDFHKTVDGLKLAQNQAIALYNELRKIDSTLTSDVFNNLRQSFEAAGAECENIAATMASIKKLEAVEVKNDDVKQRLDLYKQIAALQMQDPKQYDFMNRSLPDYLQGPENYWNSIGSAFASMQEAASTGYIDISDFYNIVNEMNNLATLGENIEFLGATLDGSLTSASELIQQGLNALTNIEGEGAKIDLSQFGIDFATGADLMSENVEDGIHAMAESQIKMLDGMIALLETVVQMEKLGEITGDGKLDLEDMFNIEGDTATFTSSMREWSEGLLVAAQNNEDLTNALDSILFGGTSLRTMFENAANEMTSLSETEAQQYFAAISSLYQMFLSGDYDLENLMQSISNVASASGFTGEIQVGDTQLAVGYGVTLVQDEHGWLVNGTYYDTAEEALEALRSLSIPEAQLELPVFIDTDNIIKNEEQFKQATHEQIMNLADALANKSSDEVKAAAQNIGIEVTLEGELTEEQRQMIANLANIESKVTSWSISAVFAGPNGDELQKLLNEPNISATVTATIDDGEVITLADGLQVKATKINVTYDGEEGETYQVNATDASGNPLILNVTAEGQLVSLTNVVTGEDVQLAQDGKTPGILFFKDANGVEWAAEVTANATLNKLGTVNWTDGEAITATKVSLAGTKTLVSSNGQPIVVNVQADSKVTSTDGVEIASKLQVGAQTKLKEGTYYLYDGASAIIIDVAADSTIAKVGEVTASENGYPVTADQIKNIGYVKITHNGKEYVAQIHSNGIISMLGEVTSEKELSSTVDLDPGTATLVTTNGTYVLSVESDGLIAGLNEVGTSDSLQVGSTTLLDQGIHILKQGRKIYSLEVDSNGTITKIQSVATPETGITAIEYPEAGTIVTLYKNGAVYVAETQGNGLLQILGEVNYNDQDIVTTSKLPEGQAILYSGASVYVAKVGANGEISQLQDVSTGKYYWCGINSPLPEGTAVLMIGLRKYAVQIDANGEVTSIKEIKVPSILKADALPGADTYVKVTDMTTGQEYIAQVEATTGELSVIGEVTTGKTVTATKVTEGDAKLYVNGEEYELKVTSKAIINSTDGVSLLKSGDDNIIRLGDSINLPAGTAILQYNDGTAVAIEVSSDGIVTSINTVNLLTDENGALAATTISNQKIWVTDPRTGLIYVVEVDANGIISQLGIVSCAKQLGALWLPVGKTQVWVNGQPYTVAVNANGNISTLSGLNIADQLTLGSWTSWPRGKVVLYKDGVPYVLTIDGQGRISSISKVDIPTEYTPTTAIKHQLETKVVTLKDDNGNQITMPVISPAQITALSKVDPLSEFKLSQNQTSILQSGSVKLKTADGNDFTANAEVNGSVATLKNIIWPTGENNGITIGADQGYSGFITIYQDGHIYEAYLTANGTLMGIQEITIPDSISLTPAADYQQKNKIKKYLLVNDSLGNPCVLGLTAEGEYKLISTLVKTDTIKLSDEASEPNTMKLVNSEGEGYIINLEGDGSLGKIISLVDNGEIDATTLDIGTYTLYNGSEVYTIDVEAQGDLASIISLITQANNTVPYTGPAIAGLTLYGDDNNPYTLAVCAPGVATINDLNALRLAENLKNQSQKLTKANGKAQVIKATANADVTFDGVESAQFDENVETTTVTDASGNIATIGANANSDVTIKRVESARFDPSATTDGFTMTTENGDEETVNTYANGDLTIDAVTSTQFGDYAIDANGVAVTDENGATEQVDAHADGTLYLDGTSDDVNIDSFLRDDGTVDLGTYEGTITLSGVKTDNIARTAFTRYFGKDLGEINDILSNEIISGSEYSSEPWTYLDDNSIFKQYLLFLHEQINSGVKILSGNERNFLEKMKNAFNDRVNNVFMEGYDWTTMGDLGDVSSTVYENKVRPVTDYIQELLDQDEINAFTQDSSFSVLSQAFENLNYTNLLLCADAMEKLYTNAYKLVNNITWENLVEHLNAINAPAENNVLNNVNDILKHITFTVATEASDSDLLAQEIIESTTIERTIKLIADAADIQNILSNLDAIINFSTNTTPTTPTTSTTQPTSTPSISSSIIDVLAGVAAEFKNINTQSVILNAVLVGTAKNMAEFPSGAPDIVGNLATNMGDIPSVSGRVFSLANAMNTIPAIANRITALNDALKKVPENKKIGITATITVNANGGTVTKQTPSASTEIPLTQARGNVALAGGRKQTLMGELGPELVVSNGRYFLVGQNGAEMIDLPEDAIVFNHLQTKRLLSSRTAGRGIAVTNERNATSMATGNVEGPAMASAASALAALKQIRAMWQSMLGADLKDLGQQAGSGSGGGGGKEKNTIDPGFIADLERWYNLLRQIDRLEKSINYEEKLRQKIANDSMSNGKAYYESQKRSLEALQQQIVKQEELSYLQQSYYEARRRDLASTNFGKIFTFNENGLMQYNDTAIMDNGDRGGLFALAKINAQNPDNSPVYSAREQYALLQAWGFAEDLKYDSEGELIEWTDEEGEAREEAYTESLQAFWDKVDGWKDELDSLYDSYTDALNNLLDEEQQRNELLKEIRDNQLSLEQKVLKAIEAREQEIIDNLQDERDALQDATDAYINGLNEQLDRERDMYQRQQDAEDLNKLRRQLAILQRSGGAASQIRSLQNQIQTKEQDAYFDAQQEQIDAIEKASDKEIERLDAQLDIMKESLEYQKEHGLLWAEVAQIMAKSPEEIMQFLVTWTPEFKGVSALDFEVQMQELKGSIDQWVALREDKENPVEADKDEAGTGWRAWAVENQPHYSKVWNERSAAAEQAYRDTYGINSNPTEAAAAARKILETALSEYYRLHPEENPKNAANLIPLDGSGGNGGPSGGSGGSGSGGSGSGYSAPTLTGTSGWKTNSTHHWKVETYSDGSTKEVDKGAHVAGDWEYGQVSGRWQKTCKICGYIMQVTYTDPTIKKPNSNETIISDRNNKLNLMKYSSGGLANYTGLAMVHGTPTRPEAFLNAAETKMWKDDILSGRRGSLTNSLIEFQQQVEEMTVSGLLGNTTNNNGNITIEHAEVNMNATISNDYDARRAGQNALDEMVKIARKSSVQSLRR